MLETSPKCTDQNQNNKCKTNIQQDRNLPDFTTKKSEAGAVCLWRRETTMNETICTPEQHILELIL